MQVITFTSRSPWKSTSSPKLRGKHSTSPWQPVAKQHLLQMLSLLSVVEFIFTHLLLWIVPGQTSKWCNDARNLWAPKRPTWLGIVTIFVRNQDMPWTPHDGCEWNFWRGNEDGGVTKASSPLQQWNKTSTFKSLGLNMSRLQPLLYKWGFPKMVVPNNHGFSY